MNNSATTRHRSYDQTRHMFLRRGTTRGISCHRGQHRTTTTSIVMEFHRFDNDPSTYCYSTTPGTIAVAQRECIQLFYYRREDSTQDDGDDIRGAKARRIVYKPDHTTDVEPQSCKAFRQEAAVMKAEQSPSAQNRHGRQQKLTS